MGKIRLGMIGAGKMAEWHLRAYSQDPRVELVALCNRTSPRGQWLKKKFGIREHYTDAYELIEKAPVDAVDISVPTRLHFGFLKAALRRGLHVYCEKPLVSASEEFEEVLRLQQQARRVVFNGYNYRYLPEFLEIQRRLKDIGEARYLRFFRTTKEKPDSYMMTDEGLGIFREFHSHFVDFLDALGFSHPTEVKAYGTRVHPWDLTPDTATSVLKFGSGALAEITTSFASPGVAPSMFIVGTKGTLRLDYGKVQFTPLRDQWSLPSLILQMFREAMVLPFRVLKNPFKGSCHQFIEDVVQDQTQSSGVKRAHRVHRICENLQASFDAGLVGQESNHLVSEPTSSAQPGQTLHAPN